MARSMGQSLADYWWGNILLAIGLGALGYYAHSQIVALESGELKSINAWIAFAYDIAGKTGVDFIFLIAVVAFLGFAVIEFKNR